MKLAIQGLKPMYETLSKAIDAYAIKGSDSQEEMYGALNELCRIILCSQTTYEGMSPMNLTMHIENDMRYVSGLMTEQQMEQHLHYHWDLIAQREKELLDLIEQQKQEQGREKKQHSR